MEERSCRGAYCEGRSNCVPINLPSGSAPAKDSSTESHPLTKLPAPFALTVSIDIFSRPATSKHDTRSPRWTSSLVIWHSHKALGQDDTHGGSRNALLGVWRHFPSVQSSFMCGIPPCLLTVLLNISQQTGIGEWAQAASASGGHNHGSHLSTPAAIRARATSHADHRRTACEPPSATQVICGLGGQTH